MKTDCVCTRRYQYLKITSPMHYRIFLIEILNHVTVLLFDTQEPTSSSPQARILDLEDRNEGGLRIRVSQRIQKIILQDAKSFWTWNRAIQVVTSLDAPWR